MLDQQLKEQLGAYLSKLVRPVELHMNLDDSDASSELGNLADELSALTTLITVVVNRDENIRAPLMQVISPDTGSNIAFAGIPMGHEFTSLVLALLHTGSHPSKEEASLLEQIKLLEGNFNFEVYVSLGCQTCPDVVQALNLMAAQNSNVTSTMIDGALFQSEIETHNILAVPTVLLNGKPSSQGRMKSQ